MSFSAYYVQQCRDRITELAQTMMNGERPYIEGIRLILDLTNPARLDQIEEPFVNFLAIYSQTDDIPVGELREKWHPEAKIKLGPEWAKAEEYAKTFGEPACREAITWLAAHPFDVS
jgi:hypothetical protein